MKYNTVNPATNVTECALVIEQTFREAGFPENVFRTILAGHDTVGELADKNLKKVVLELGGPNPFIVLDDADKGVVIDGSDITVRNLRDLPLIIEVLY